MRLMERKPKRNKRISTHQVSTAVQHQTKVVNTCMEIMIMTVFADAISQSYKNLIEIIADKRVS